MRRNQRKRKQTNGGNVHQLIKAVERLQNQRPVPIRIPRTPPPIEYLLQINKVIEVYVIQYSSDTWVFGSPAEPTKMFIKPGGTGPSYKRTGNVSTFDLIKMFSCSLIRQPLRNLYNGTVTAANVGQERQLPLDAFNIFPYLRLNSVKMWGPTTSDQAGYPIELTLSDLYVTRAKFENPTAGGPSMVRESTATSRDMGSRTSRAKVGLSIPAPKWWPVGQYTAELAVPDISCIFFEIGFASNNAEHEFLDSDILAVMHISMSGLITREKDDDAFTHYKPRTFEDDNRVPLVEEEREFEVLSRTSSRPTERHFPSRRQ